jgi:hypothetical protein
MFLCAFHALFMIRENEVVLELNLFPLGSYSREVIQRAKKKVVSAAIKP